MGRLISFPLRLFQPAPSCGKTLSEYSMNPFFQCGIQAIQHLSDKTTKRVCQFVAALLHKGLRNRQQVAMENIIRVLGPVERNAMDSLLYQSWVNLVEVAMGIVRFSAHGEGYLHKVQFHDEHFLSTSLRQGQGVILVSAHTGNYFLCASWLAQKYPVAVVVRSSRQPSVRQTLHRLYRAMGIEPIERVGGMAGILRALRRNSIVIMAMDQHAGSNGIWVDFFNEPASTFATPALLALKQNCPIHTGFAHRHPDGLNEAWISGPLPTRTGDSTDASVEAITRNINQEIERFVRQHPETWMWMHRRWKAQEE